MSKLSWGSLAEIIRAMQSSKGYLMFHVILLLGLLQKVNSLSVSGNTQLVTGFLHQPIYLAVKVNDSSSVQTIRWKIGVQVIVEHTSSLSAEVFPMFKERMDYIAENNSLLIHRLSLQDEGQYISITSFESGAEVGSYINLTVLVPVSQPSITVQTENDPYPTVTMNCTVENGSSPQFSWTKDNIRVSTGHQSLRIANLNGSACGVYTCLVQNPVNSVERQQWISDEHFQGCYHPLCHGPGCIVGSTLAILCAVGFLAVILVVKYKGRQREDKALDEQGQANVPDAGEVPSVALYHSLLLIHSGGNQETINSTYCTIGSPP
ncbi:hepatocyte cell adhesion molecule-like [Leucoraja erinacea]|uniref:hepatocyte cell adhesion molecule-like n=1 Tax=Leucoraja erinaceus TaxID=7782 RepID=UPI0024555669|nr:hepatocyte cell adhesion molecule-like [Leucoraja erinacea]